MKKIYRINTKGITLIELLIALVICGFVIAGIYRVFIAQTRAYTVQDQVVEVQQGIRSAMEILLRDVRMSGYDSDSLTSKISIADPITPADHSVKVNYEYDDTHRYEVTYSLMSGSLTRRLTIYSDVGLLSDATETILENVDALNFEYGVDNNHDGVLELVQAAGIDPTKVMAVRVVLTAKPDQTNPDVKNWVSPRTLTSTVALRNQSLKW